VLPGLLAVETRAPGREAGRSRLVRRGGPGIIKQVTAACLDRREFSRLPGNGPTLAAHEAEPGGRRKADRQLSGRIGRLNGGRDLTSCRSSAPKNAIVKNIHLSLVVLLSLAAPVMGAVDDNTLVITLRGLPPPSIQPSPPSSHPSPYRQPPVQAAPLPQARQDEAAASGRSSGALRDVVGRLGVCVWPGAAIYRGQDGGGQLLARVAQGTYLAIKSDYAGWYGVMMIDGSLGWIPKNAVRLLDYNVVRPPAGGPSTEPAEAGRLGAEVLKQAFKYLGVPYVWGGNGPSGLDCSGLVKNCFGSCGILLPRRASEQARVGQPVPLTLSALRPGDRLYFAVGRSSIDHTGIYLGNGYFIHASMSRGRVAIDHLSRPLYGRHLVAARRMEAGYPSQALSLTRH
jgi:NlpC/P60 family/Bacterial SH3 domain